MAQVSQLPTHTNVSHKVILGILVIFIFFSVLIFILGRYYKIATEVGNQLIKSDDQTEQITELKENYKFNFSAMLGNYLIEANKSSDLLTDSFLNQTREVKQKLLALKVPAELKDYHLSTVLLLENIEKNISSGNNELMVAKLGDLSAIVNNF